MVSVPYNDPTYNPFDHKDCPPDATHFVTFSRDPMFETSTRAAFFKSLEEAEEGRKHLQENGFLTGTPWARDE